MLIGLYLLYAFIQAVIFARAAYERDHPVLLVFGLTLFAPMVTVVLLFYSIGDGIKWLVTYRNE
jgi:uncharacterized membrane protein